MAWCPVLRNQGRQHADHPLRRRAQRHIQRQPFARELVHHGQAGARSPIGQSIFDNVIGPTMTRIGRLKPRWARATQPFAHHMTDLKPMRAPQAADTFVIDALGRCAQRMHAAIAIARVLSGQGVPVRYAQGLVPGVSSRAEGRAMQLGSFDETDIKVRYALAASYNDPKMPHSTVTKASRTSAKN
jgi:hypothetical protein